MNRLLGSLLLSFGCVLLPVASAAQAPGAAPRRLQLEQQVMQRFLQRASSEMALPAEARPRLAAVVRDGMAERRALHQDAIQLRRRMVQLLQDGAARDTEFEQVLEQQRQLRVREHTLWQREQQRLSEILSPRQQAQFSVLWLRLQEDARALLQQRTPGPPRGL